MTAEWKCTSCGVTNRRLVSDEDTQAKDRCVSCKTKHVIERGERPIFWNARAA